MKFQIIQPSKFLSELIRFYWILESNEPYTHYTMADVCPELVFHYHGQFDELLGDGLISKSFVSGLQGQNNMTRAFSIDKGFGIFGVYFYPHAISVLFNIPTLDLTNHLVNLNDLLGQEGKELEERIMLAENNQARVEILENFLQLKLSKSRNLQLPIYKAIKTIIQDKGLVKINRLVGDYSLSERQFERQFCRYAGFSPKLFSRIVRFHSAMDQYGKNKKTLTKIALDCGYYDQSHFINDFKEFSGLNPKEFFSGVSEATRWRD